MQTGAIMITGSAPFRIVAQHPVTRDAQQVYFGTMGESRDPWGRVSAIDHLPKRGKIGLVLLLLTALKRGAVRKNAALCEKTRRCANNLAGVSAPYIRAKCRIFRFSTASRNWYNPFL